MKLSHLAVAIVVIIATIVIAIITAFSIVTFNSLDKAVTNAMNAEIQLVRTSATGIITRTMNAATTLRNYFLANGWVYSKLPLRVAGQTEVGVDVSAELGNWTSAFEIL